MAALSSNPSVNAWALSEAETIALAYLRDAGNDRWEALVRLAQDALSDLDRAEASIRDRGALVSRGDARAGIGRR